MFSAARAGQSAYVVAFALRRPVRVCSGTNRTTLQDGHAGDRQAHRVPRQRAWIARLLLAFSDSERRDLRQGCGRAQALQAHASERGLTITAALVELVEQGLEATAHERSVAELERQLAASTSELGQTRARLREAELGLQAAREREHTSARTSRALAERTRQPLASRAAGSPCAAATCLSAAHCPNPNCGRALSSLLTPIPRAGLDRNEYLALLGALGVLVGLALHTTAARAG